MIISAPFFKLRDNSEINNASVPEPTVQTYFDPVNFDNFLSNFLTLFPKIKLFSFTVF